MTRPATPLPWLLLLLSVTTGLVDAISVLSGDALREEVLRQELAVHLGQRRARVGHHVRQVLARGVELQDLEAMPSWEKIDKDETEGESGCGTPRNFGHILSNRSLS